MGTTLEFNYTGASQTWQVPAEVTAITIQAWGAGGGSGDRSANGGAGAYVTGTIAVTPGNSYNIYAGGGGKAGSGGGFSGIKLGTSWLLIAAGGGGGGSSREGGGYNGGAGGLINGSNGIASSGVGTSGGGGGTQTSGGIAGADGYMGSAYQGGSGFAEYGINPGGYNGGGNGSLYGGGGGGGLYGGGGSGHYSGAGGGSSLIPPGGSGFAGSGNMPGLVCYKSNDIGQGATTSDAGGNGFITISYSPPMPVLNHSFPMDGATNVGTNIIPIVTFSRDMNVTSTLANLSLTPNITGGQWKVSGNNKTFYYASGALSVSTSYTIHIGIGATDAVGNPLAQAVDVVFTTGTGISAQEPSRHNLNPPQEIVETTGKIVDVDASQLMATATEYNAANYDAYLDFAYHVRAKSVTGSINDASLDFFTGTDYAANPPELIYPFRNMVRYGQVFNIPLDFMLGNDSKATEAVMYAYLNVQQMLRKLPRSGQIVDVTDFGIQKLPLILSYNFVDEEELDGTLHKLSNRKPAISWDNPQDPGVANINYRVEISKHPLFVRSLVFDSFLSKDAFFVSDDGINYSPMLDGAIPNTGKTKFVCPVTLETGIWYVRLRAGNLERGGVIWAQSQRTY